MLMKKRVARGARRLRAACHANGVALSLPAASALAGLTLRQGPMVLAQSPALAAVPAAVVWQQCPCGACGPVPTVTLFGVPLTTIVNR